MSHPPSRRRRNARDEAHRRLIRRIVFLQEIRRVLFRRPSNLPNHDDSIRLLISQENIQAVDKIRPRERIPADAHNERLAQPRLRGLVDSFVGERAGSRDDPYPATLVDEAWHDADLALAWGDDAWAVGAYESCLALGFEDVGYADHVVLGDAFRYADDKGQFGFDGFFDSFGC